MVTRGQARKQSVAQECNGPGDDDTDGSDSSSVPCESTKGDVNGGSNSASGGRASQSADPGSSIASRGSQLVPGSTIATGSLNGLLMS